VQAFQQVALRCRANGFKVLGYVDSAYAKIPIAQVLSEMDKYTAWFGVDGFFIDQGTMLALFAC
jgi:hypothetical protein